MSKKNTKYTQSDWAETVRKNEGKSPVFVDQYRFSGRTFRVRDMPGPKRSS